MRAQEPPPAPLRLLIGGDHSISSISLRAEGCETPAASAFGILGSLLATPRTFPASGRVCAHLHLHPLPLAPPPTKWRSRQPRKPGVVRRGQGGRGRNPRVARHYPGLRSAAVAARQPPKRLVSCTAGRAGLGPRWAGRAWGAPALRGAPCSAPRVGAASPPPSRLWPATFPA